MSILRWLLRKDASLPTIEHPVFGKLEATLINDDGTYFWETSRELETPKGSIGIFFDAAQNSADNIALALGFTR